MKFIKNKEKEKLQQEMRDNNKRKVIHIMLGKMFAVD